MGERKSFLAEEREDQDDLEMKSSKSRNHMKNRERAYTAASRRSDRSLEARYQSALMASELHKRRTGKFLRVTHEIVAKEEMYEEDDHILPQLRRSSPKRTKCTAKSRTDAYIAALIARRAGVPNLSQQNQNLAISQFAKTMPWNPLKACNLANNEDSKQPWYHEPEFNLPEDTLGYFNELNWIDTLRASGDQSSVAESCFMDPALFYEVTCREHSTSVASSISDTPIHDSQFTIEVNSESEGSNTGEPSLHLDDCLVDFNCESFLNLIQNGAVGYYE